MGFPSNTVRRLPWDLKAAVVVYQLYINEIELT